MAVIMYTKNRTCNGIDNVKNFNGRHNDDGFMKGLRGHSLQALRVFTKNNKLGDYDSWTPVFKQLTTSS